MRARLAIGHLLSLLAWLVLPNLAFVLLAHYLFTSRLPINVDYLVIGILACFFRHRYARLAAVSLTLVTDLLLSFCPIFYFSLDAALSSARSLRFLNSWQLAAYTSALVLTVVALTLLIEKLSSASERLVPLRVHRAVPLFACLVLMSAIEIWNGGTRFLFRPKTLLPRICNSQLHHALQAHLAARRWNSSLAEHRVTSLTNASAEMPSSAFHSIVFITAESWGRLLSSQDRSLLESIVTVPARNAGFDVATGEIPFDGPTISGEFRELCGTGVPQDLKLVSGDHCLPSHLRQLGYSTYAIHANTGAMYERETWYPLVGFEHTLFGEQLQSRGIRSRCGVAFPAACDEAVAGYISDLLHSPEKRFLYWMTLEAHLPISSSDAVRSQFDCNSLTTRDPEICSFLKVQWNTLHSIARIIERAARTNTAFVIVGDHAPPFLLPARRALWDQQHVPYILITPAAPRPASPAIAAHRTRAQHIPHPVVNSIHASAALDGMF